MTTWYELRKDGTLLAADTDIAGVRRALMSIIRAARRAGKVAIKLDPDTWEVWRRTDRRKPRRNYTTPLYTLEITEADYPPFLPR